MVWEEKKGKKRREVGNEKDKTEDVKGKKGKFNHKAHFL